MRTVYELCKNVVVIWGVCITLLVLFFFKKNKLANVQELNLEREYTTRSVVEGLEAKLRRANKQLEKVKGA